MTVRRVSTGTSWESVVGYSRAVAAGDTIYVSGCTSVEGGAYDQTVRSLATVRAALEQLGASMSQVVRTRLYVTDIADWEEVGRAHREVFAGVLPATALMQVAGLIDPRMLVEVEAVAWTGTGSTP
ncbi:MAG: RidA family protein [Mycobacteriales bacterium]